MTGFVLEDSHLTSSIITENTSDPLTCVCLVSLADLPLDELNIPDVQILLPAVYADDVVSNGTVIPLSVACSDYVVIIVDMHNFPPSCCNTWLHNTLKCALLLSPKPLVILHTTSANTWYANSYMLIAEILELYYSVEHLIIHKDFPV